ncbi:MAG: type II secretion system protein [Proteobacteria bacterium]|nr:type II secretion system protein [Pseudomonadota bacterium]
MAQPLKHDHSEQGFTLLEIVISMLVFAMATYVVHQFQARDHNSTEKKERMYILQYLKMKTIDVLRDHDRFFPFMKDTVYFACFNKKLVYTHKEANSEKQLYGFVAIPGDGIASEDEDSLVGCLLKQKKVGGEHKRIQCKAAKNQDGFLCPHGGNNGAQYLVLVIPKHEFLDERPHHRRFLIRVIAMNRESGWIKFHLLGFFFGSSRF